MKLKRGNSVIDVPENKVTFFLHAGYSKIEDAAPPKKSKEFEHEHSQDGNSVFDKLTGRKDR